MRASRTRALAVLAAALSLPFPGCAEAQSAEAPDESEVFRCELGRVVGGGWEGPCAGLEMDGVRKTASVRFDAGPEAEGPWLGRVYIDRGYLDVELAEEDFGDGTRLVMRENIIFWFLAYEWLRKADGSVVLVFNMEDEARPSQRDIAILEDAVARFERIEAWDRNDDRDCTNDEPGVRSLFCVLYDAVTDEMGRYQHRQPGLQLLRAEIGERWPDRLAGHRLRDFNNHPATTREEVLDLLRSSIDRILSQWDIEHWAGPVG